MKKPLATMALILAGATPAFASPSAFVGVTFNFGGDVGVSLKVLSTDREDRGALAVGGTWFPRSNTFGVDAGGAYLFRNSAVTAGWDFLKGGPQFGVGYVDTRE